MTLQVSNEGYCLKIMDGGQLSASHVSFIECKATVTGDSYDNARGGAAFVGSSSRAHFNNVTFHSCYAPNAQQGALAATITTVSTTSFANTTSATTIISAASVAITS